MTNHSRHGKVRKGKLRGRRGGGAPRLRVLRARDRILGWLLGLGLLFVLSGVTIIAVYSYLAKSYDLTKLGEMPQRTVVFDCHGQVMGRIHGENRIVVPLGDVSPWFIQALIAREDSRFHLHHGIDYAGLVRAFLRNLKDGRIVQGASTLTMQLARNSYPDLNDRSLHRKLLEMMLARRIEKACTKQQILEYYVNRIFFGPGLYGIQRASQMYFGKHASQLTLSEAALIAGIIRGPSRFSPFRNFNGALRERDDVLARMVKLKMISDEQALAARYEDLAVHAQPAFRTQGGYALDAVSRDLELILEEREIEDGGLQVFTTIDLNLQHAAERAMEIRLAQVERSPGYAHLAKAAFDLKWNGIDQMDSTPYLQGSITVLDNVSGGILSLVGGRDYRQSKFNRATQGDRQAGSVVKPFVYAAAIERGMLPGSWVNDAPLSSGEIVGAGADWKPENADGKYLGMQPLALGLIQSRNLMAIRAGSCAGLDRVRQVYRDAGLGLDPPLSPQIFLGNLGCNTRKVASAYSVFANCGMRRRPFLIDRVLDRAGRIIYSTPVLENRVLSPGVTFLTRRMLLQVVEQGTASAIRHEFGIDAVCGAKTGTTNDYRDAWLAGFTDRLSCAVWVGMDKPVPVLQGGYGSKLALPIWCDVVRNALGAGYGSDSSLPLVPVTRVALCRSSGALATEACRSEAAIYEDEIPYELVPHDFCHTHGTQSRESPVPSPGEVKSDFWDRLKRWFR